MQNLAISQISGKPYSPRMASMLGSGLLGYYPGDEIAGTNINDISGNGRNGLYVASPTLANLLSPSGKMAPLFNGSTQYINLVTSGLQSVWSGQEGSVSFWAKALNSAVWDSVSNVGMFVSTVNASNSMNIYHQGVTAKSLRADYTAGAVLKGGNYTLYYPSAWVHISLSWSKVADQLILRYNGAPTPTITGLGAWAGTPATLRWGAVSGATWNGWLADLAVTNRPITDDEAYLLASTAPAHRIKRMSYLGDSITAESNTTWVDQIQNERFGGAVASMNRAVFGQTIQNNMAAQVAACANDHAHEVIIALGANDDNNGDMVALRAIYEAGINALQTSNAGVVIYLMNVWPVWNADDTPKDKSNIRAMIDAVGAAYGLTVWQPYSEAWYDVTDTGDKVHPNASGSGKIKTQVLARLP